MDSTPQPWRKATLVPESKVQVVRATDYREACATGEPVSVHLPQGLPALRAMSRIVACRSSDRALRRGSAPANRRRVRTAARTETAAGVRCGTAGRRFGAATLPFHRERYASGRGRGTARRTPLATREDPGTLRPGGPHEQNCKRDSARERTIDVPGPCPILRAPVTRLWRHLLRRLARPLEQVLRRQSWRSGFPSVRAPPLGRVAPLREAVPFFGDRARETLHPGVGNSLGLRVHVRVRHLAFRVRLERRSAACHLDDLERAGVLSRAPRVLLQRGGAFLRFRLRSRALSPRRHAGSEKQNGNADVRPHGPFPLAPVV